MRYYKNGVKRSMYSNCYTRWYNIDAPYEEKSMADLWRR